MKSEDNGTRLNERSAQLIVVIDDSLSQKNSTRFLNYIFKDFFDLKYYESRLFSKEPIADRFSYGVK